MLSRTHRLDALTKHYSRRPASTPALDLSALTMEECFELDAILATLEGVPALPTVRPDLSPLSDPDLERLEALAAHLTMKDPP
jgi:hypothetical protein